MKRHIWRVGGVLVVVAVIVAVIAVFGPPGSEAGCEQTPGAEAGRTPGLIALARPAFAAGTAGVNFLEKEAGISAYVNVGREIDLARAREALIGISSEGESYIIGTVALAGNPEEQYPLVYIHRDGWVVAFYTKFAPTSRIMQWVGYDGRVIATTTLEDAIAEVCRRIGVDFLRIQGDIKYYDFRHPNATTLVLAADIVTVEGTDTFNFSIPFNVTLYEASWSHYVFDSAESITKIDGAVVNSFDWLLPVDSVLLSCGFFEAGKLIPGRKHTVSISTRETRERTGWAGIAVLFIFSGT